MNRLLASALIATGFLVSSVLGQAPSPKEPPKAKAPPPRLEGTVKGPDGKPVEGALVTASLAVQQFGELPLLAHTDAKGHFDVPLKTGALLNVRVAARGYAGVIFRRLDPGKPLAVLLGKGGSIEGVVRDGTTSSPVAGALVEAREDGVRSVASEPDVGVVEATTDDKGHYRIEGLASALHTVVASAKGFGSATKASARVGSRVDLYLFQGASLTGSVVTAEGEPVAGALVRVEGKAALGLARTGVTRRTDSRGRFEIHGLSPGAHHVWVRHPDWAAAVTRDVLVSDDDASEISVTLGRGVPVTGRLVDSEERPVRGRVVLQEMDGEPVSSFFEDLVRVETSEAGRFRFERVPSGSHALGVAAPGYARERLECSVGEKPVDLGDVLLSVGLAIQGHVRDAAGAPIPGAVLRAMPSRPTAGYALDINEAVTEPDGSFVLTGVSSVPYRVSASAAGYAPKEIRDVEAGAGNLVVVLESGGSIRGAAVSEDGKPVAGGRVIAEPREREVFVRPSFTFADESGLFLMEDVGEGEYVVQVSAPDKVTGVVSDVVVRAGATTDVGRVVLKSGGVVRGRTVDRDGRPVAGATVTISAPANVLGQTGKTATSGGDGVFVLEGITPGVVDLVARHPLYAAARVAGLEVVPERGPTETRVVLSAGGRIEGVVRGRRAEEAVVLPPGRVRIEARSGERTATAEIVAGEESAPVVIALK